MVHNHLLGGGFGRRLEVDYIAQRRADREAGRRTGEGRLDPRGRHPARHVPAVLLRPPVRRPRRRRQAGGLDPPHRRLLDHRALGAAGLQGRPRPRRRRRRGRACPMHSRTSGSNMCGTSRPAFRPPSGAASAPPTTSSSSRASSTSWPPRPSRIRSSTAARCSTSPARAWPCSSSPPRRRLGQALAAGAGRGVSVQFAFGSYMAQVAEVEVAKDGAVQGQRVVCAVDCGMVVNPDTIEAQVEERDRLRPHRRALRRDHAQGRPGRAEQFPRLPAAAHQRDPGDRGPYRPEHRGAGRHRRGPEPRPHPPAVTNAIFAATGKRLRKLPIDTSKLKT